MNRFRNLLKKDGATSASLTGIIVVGLIVATGTAAAMEVTFTESPGTVQQSNDATFTVQLDLNDDDQYLPINNLKVDIEGKGTANVNLSTGETDMAALEANVKSGSSLGDLGYGYGYGYDADAGDGFGYGYGYGYGSNTDREIVVEFTLDTSDMSVGDHEIEASATLDKGTEPQEYSTTQTLTVESSGSSGDDTTTDDSTTGGTTTPDDNQQDDQAPEPKKVEAQVDTETGQASAQIENVGAGQQVEVSIPEGQNQQGQTNSVESVSFTSENDAEGVSVSVSNLGSNRPDQVGSDAGTDVYSYQEINIEGVEDDDISSAKVNFKVEKSFLEDRNRAPEDVVMKRYNQDSWNELDTRVGEELENAYRFEASSNGFSYYAIALNEQEDQTDQQDQTDPTNQTQNQTEEQPDQEEEKTGLPLVPILIALLITVVAGAAYIKRDEIEELMTR